MKRLIFAISAALVLLFTIAVVAPVDAQSRRGGGGGGQTATARSGGGQSHGGQAAAPRGGSGQSHATAPSGAPPSGQQRGGSTARPRGQTASSGSPVVQGSSRPRGGGPAYGTATPRTSANGQFFGRNHFFVSPYYYSPYAFGAFGLGYWGYDPFWWNWGYPYYGWGYPYYGYGPYYGGYGYGYDYGYDSGNYEQRGDRDFGSLKLKVKPHNAEVYVDGYYMGQVDDFDGAFQHLDLEAGTHRIEIRAEGYQPMVLEMRIEPGRTVTYENQLKRLQ